MRAGLGAAAGALVIGRPGPRVICAEPPAAKTSGPQSYEATVPDTLDLAERAKWALHGIANTVDPADEFQMWFEVFWNNNPAYMKHSGCDVECTPKFLDAMTQLRLACGSDEFRDIEQGMEKAPDELSGSQGRALLRPVQAASQVALGRLCRQGIPDEAGGLRGARQRRHHVDRDGFA